MDGSIWTLTRHRCPTRYKYPKRRIVFHSNPVHCLHSSERAGTSDFFLEIGVKKTMIIVWWSCLYFCLYFLSYWSQIDPSWMYGISHWSQKNRDRVIEFLNIVKGGRRTRMSEHMLCPCAVYKKMRWCSLNVRGCNLSWSVEDLWSMTIVGPSMERKSHWMLQLMMKCQNGTSMVR